LLLWLEECHAKLPSLRLLCGPTGRHASVNPMGQVLDSAEGGPPGIIIPGGRTPANLDIRPSNRLTSADLNGASPARAPKHSLAERAISRFREGGISSVIANGPGTPPTHRRSRGEVFQGGAEPRANSHVASMETRSEDSASLSATRRARECFRWSGGIALSFTISSVVRNLRCRCLCASLNASPASIELTLYLMSGCRRDSATRLYRYDLLWDRTVEYSLPQGFLAQTSALTAYYLRVRRTTVASRVVLSNNL